MSWFYVNKEGATIGPVSVNKLKSLYASNEINDKTFISHRNKANQWTVLENVSYLHSILPPQKLTKSTSYRVPSTPNKTNTKTKNTKSKRSKSSKKRSHQTRAYKKVTSPHHINTNNMQRMFNEQPIRSLQTQRAPQLSKTTSITTAANRQYTVPCKPPRRAQTVMNLKQIRKPTMSPSPPSMSTVPTLNPPKLYAGVSADDIDNFLDEIELAEQRRISTQSQQSQQRGFRKQRKPKLEFVDVDDDEDDAKMMELSVSTTRISRISHLTTRSANYLIYNNRGIRANVNWNELNLSSYKLRKENINSIRKLVGNKAIDINTQNPRDGTTLLMHAIIIGDLDLVKFICKAGVDINVKDNDGDDAIDYALIFQRYRICQLLLMLSKKLNTKTLKKVVESKEKLAEYMRLNTFGKFRDNLIRFVVKAMQERLPFEVNLMYLAWHFVVHSEDPVTGNNQYSNPLQTPLFKTMMKVYGEIQKNGHKNKKDWNWMRMYFIESIIWLLPNPVVKTTNNPFVDVKDGGGDETDDSETEVDEDEVEEEEFKDDASVITVRSATSSVGKTKEKEIEYTALVRKTKLTNDNLLAFLFL